MAASGKIAPDGLERALIARLGHTGGVLPAAAEAVSAVLERGA